MEEKLDNLFSLVSDRRKTNKPPILLLGANCSYFPGTSSSSGLEEKTIGLKKVDVLRYELEPSKIENAYKFLAKLVKENYFDIVVTTNYGNLLENALYEEGVRFGDFVVSILGINSFSQMEKKIKRPSPKIKIIKIGGDHGENVHKLIDREFLEIREVTTSILDVFTKLINERDIIIIGHSLRDPLLATILEQSNARIWYVNTNDPQKNIERFSDQAKNRTLIISDSIGYFESFLSRLYIFTRQQQTSMILKNSSAILNKIIEKTKVDCLKKGDFLLSVGRKSHFWIDIYELRDYKQLMSEVLWNYLEVSLSKQRRYTIVTVYHPEDSEKFFPTADVAEAAVSNITNPYLTHSKAIHNKFSGETTFRPSLQGECILFNVISTHLCTSLDLVNTIRTREKKEINTVITFIEREEISRKVLKSKNIDMRSFILYDEFSNRFTINDELLTKDLNKSFAERKRGDT